jgi:hypothetical protein
VIVLAVAVSYVCGVGVGFMAGSDLARRKALCDEIQRTLDRLKRLP